MLVITVHQPWAWLIVNCPPCEHGPKDLENRPWGPGRALGQRIAIHAGAKIDSRGYKRASALGIDVPPPDEIQRSAIVGTVEVTGVVTASESPWFVGPRGWTLANPIPCDPIPCRGRQSLWSTDLI